MRAQHPATRRGDPPVSPLALCRRLLLWWVVAIAASVSTGEARAEAPAVAVFPFQVHSAQAKDYLGESLANQLRTRLEAGSQVRVVDATLSAERAGREAGAQITPAALRAAGIDLGAQYVVTGTVTELGGQYSLDVRVTPVAPAQPGATVVVTARGEDELLDRVGEVADGVVRHVAGALPALVESVQLVGADGLAEKDEIEARLTTRAGEPYDPARVRDDLAALRGDPAVAQASVETEAGPAGMAVIFRVVPARRVVPGGPRASGHTIAAVEIRGNRRIEADAIRARLATRAGEPYQPRVVAKDVREIYALGFFRDVRVLTEESVSGLVVVFELEENPVVRQISISGNEHVDGDKIRDILTLTLGSALDYPLLFENRGRIESIYRAEGYYLAEVSYEVEPLSEASVGIHFIVDENEKLKLREIVFTGNEHFSDKDLREGFQTKRWRIWSYATSWFDKSGTYREPLFLQDLRSVEKKYSDAGYIQVEVGEPNVIPEKDGLTVSVAITEGKRFRVGAIDVTGDDSVDSEALTSLLALQSGEWFNRSALSDDVQRITNHYTDRGFFLASVRPLSNLSEDEEVVDVIFDVRKGPLYFVRNIQITGNTTTIDPVIRREVPMVEGQLYSAREIEISRQRIQGLGFFEEVDIQVEPTDAEDQIDLDVAVVEKPTGSFSFGAGYSSQDSFVATGSLSQTNLFGRGYAANVSVDIGAQTQRFFVNLQDPYFLGTSFSLGTTLFRTTFNFEDFEQEQTGADVVLGHSLSENNTTRGYLRYSFASRSLQEDQNTVAASLIVRDLYQNDVTSSSIGLNVVSDTRDNRIAPTSGYQYGAGIDFAGLGFFARFMRAEARGTYYLGAPSWLPEKSTFVVSSRIGYTLPLNQVSDYDFPAGSVKGADGNMLPLRDIDDDLTLPLSERYFLGGLGQFQLRGFKARSVGPRRTLIYRETGSIETGGGSGSYLPTGRRPAFLDTETGQVQDNFDPDNPFLVPTTVCDDDGSVPGNGDGKCNDLDDKDVDDFDDLDDTDVIGGNKFISTSFEYRFPLSETLGLQGLVFLDMGNAFAEGDLLFNVMDWRYGTGAGVQWFSPFGPLAVIIGFPLDRLSVEDSFVFEFSVGGQGF